jgi:hypothetical protein
VSCYAQLFAVFKCSNARGPSLQGKDTHLRALLYRNFSKSPLDSCRESVLKLLYSRVSYNILQASCIKKQTIDPNERYTDSPPPPPDTLLEQSVAGQNPFMFSRTRSWETEILAETAEVTLHDCNNSIVQSQESHTPPADDLKSLSREHFYQSVTESFIEDRKNLVLDAMADCSGGGAVETCDSVLSIHCSKWIGIFWLCFLALIINKFFACLQLMLDDSKCKGRLFRFIPLQLRGNSTSAITEPGIGEFGLLHRGCGLRAASTRASGSNLVADFGEEVAMNGWWLSTLDQPAALDPVRFVIDVSRDGETWTQCGASRFDAVFARDQRAGIGWAIAEHRTTLKRGGTDAFNMALPWQFAVDHVLVFLVHSVAIINVIVHLLLGRPTHAVSSFVISHRCCSALYFISAVGYALDCDFLVCTIPATYSAQFFLQSLYQLGSRKNALKVTSFNAAAFSFAGLVQYAAVFGGSRRLIDGYRNIIQLDIITAFGTGAVCLAIHIYARRLHRCSVSSAQALVAADHNAYNSAWMVCLGDGSASFALKRIEVFITSQWGKLRPAVLRQRSREADPQAQLRAPPINSLEQLFGQAAVLVMFLRAKAKGWALQSEGRFPVVQGDVTDDASGGQDVVFELWKDIRKDGGKIRRVRWAKIKSKKRSVEKVYRCYAGDISRLVDCCRYCTYLVHSK